MTSSSKPALPVIRRLPKYYRYLINMQQAGKKNVPSSELSKMMGTAASQVRQYFNCFGGFGQQGIGYKVDTLVNEIRHLLFGDGTPLPTILVGAGRLGTAVSQFLMRDANGYTLLAAFDSNPDLVGKTLNGIPIRHIDELQSFCSQHHPLVAVLCLPREGATQISSTLVNQGVKGFWNFSHYDLSVDYPQVMVENVHLGDSLMSLGYHMRNM